MLLVMKALPSHSNVATICLAVVVLLLVDLEVFNGVSLPEQCQLYEQKILPMSKQKILPGSPSGFKTFGACMCSPGRVCSLATRYRSQAYTDFLEHLMLEKQLW